MVPVPEREWMVDLRRVSPGSQEEGEEGVSPA